MLTQLECYKALCSLIACNWVYLYWVPNHIEIWGNKLADDLVGSFFICPEPVFGVLLGFNNPVMGTMVLVADRPKS